MIDICVRMQARAEQGSSISDFPILLTMGAVENLVYLPMVNWSNKKVHKSRRVYNLFKRAAMQNLVKTLLNLLDRWLHYS